MTRPKKDKEPGWLALPPAERESRLATAFVDYSQVAEFEGQGTAMKCQKQQDGTFVLVWGDDQKFLLKIEALD